MSSGTDLFEIIHSTRAMRRLKPDRVPDDLIHQVLRAGTAAANGGGRQQWHFLVVKDPETKRRVQEYYLRAFEEVVKPNYERSSPPPGSTREKFGRQIDAVAYLTHHYHEAPVWIVACLSEGQATPTRGAGGSIYPAVQNMLLAIRALGLGSTLTTRHIMFEKEVDEILALPPGVRSYAILPIGYPMGRFGPVGRGPIGDVVSLDTWGSPYPGLE